MKIASRKDIIWLSVVLLIILGLDYERESAIEENDRLACPASGVIFPSPANIPYDVIFYEEGADGTDCTTFTEIRLKSKSPPYKQKSVFRYDPEHIYLYDPGHDDDAEHIPKIRWLSPHDLEISLGYLSEVEYRYNKIRDINIHYNMKTAWPEGSNGAGGTDPWE